MKELKNLHRAFPPTPDFVHDAVRSGFRKGRRRAQLRRKLQMACSIAAAVALLIGVFSLAAPKYGSHRPDYVQPSVFGQGLGTLYPGANTRGTPAATDLQSFTPGSGTSAPADTPAPSDTPAPEQTSDAAEAPVAPQISEISQATPEPTPSPTPEPTESSARFVEAAADDVPADPSFYSAEDSVYYHLVPDCPCANRAVEHTREEIDALGQLPCPYCIEGQNFVFYTKGGRYYHLDVNCSGMVGAQAYSLSEAEEMGKAACPICVWGEAAIYSTDAGRYYHSDASCSGMTGAIPRTLEEAESLGQSPCPLCISAPEINISIGEAVDYAMNGTVSAEMAAGYVRSADSSRYYHANADCSEIEERGQARLISEAESLGQQPCPVCMEAGALGVWVTLLDEEAELATYRASLNGDLLWLTERDLLKAGNLEKIGDEGALETYLSPTEQDRFRALQGEGEICGFRRTELTLQRSDAAQALAGMKTRMEGGAIAFEIYAREEAEEARFEMHTNTRDYFLLDGELYAGDEKAGRMGVSGELGEDLYSLDGAGEELAVRVDSAIEQPALYRAATYWGECFVQARADMLYGDLGDGVVTLFVALSPAAGDAAEGEATLVSMMAQAGIETDASRFVRREDGVLEAWEILSYMEAEEAMTKWNMPLGQYQTIFRVGENFSAEAIEVQMEQDAGAFLAALYQNGALPQPFAVRSFQETNGRGVLDLSGEFGEAMRSADNAQRYRYMGSIADTFLLNYGLDSLLVYSEGESLMTGDARYDGEQSWY